MQRNKVTCGLSACEDNNALRRAKRAQSGTAVQQTVVTQSVVAVVSNAPAVREFRGGGRPRCGRKDMPPGALR